MKKKYTQSIENLTKRYLVTLCKKTSFLFFIVMSLLISQDFYGQCSVAINTAEGAKTFNGVTVSEESRSNAVWIYSVPNASGRTPTARYYCDGSPTPTSTVLVFGASGYSQPGYYSYTFKFSKPVNDIVFNIWEFHAGESHSVSTDVGSASLIVECTGYKTNSSGVISGGTVSVTGTTMSSNAPLLTGTGDGASARVRIHNTVPFTRLTMSGYGTWANGYNGSWFNLCSGSIVPAVPPTISGITPATQTRCINTPAQTITVNAIGATSYQWYMNTTNSTTGATAIPGATSASYTPPNTSPLGTLYYYVVATNANGSTTSPIAQVTTESCACYKPGIPATAGKPSLITKIGISSLTRTPAQNADNWPAARKGGWLALEARTKGFVPNRLAFNSSGNPVGIAPANFVEGMMVYDITNKCLKMYTSKDGGTTLGWYCMTTQACPD